MHRVQFREARFEDYAGIATLEHSQGLTSKPFDEWRRMWTGNPSYEQLGQRWPIGWVLTEGDRIAGCLSNIPLSYTFHGQPLLVAAGRGWAVEEQYRSYSPLLMDEYFNQANVDIFLNNTVNSKAAKAFDTFGSSRVPLGDWESAVFAVVRHRGFAESALRIKDIPQSRLLSYPAGLALWVKDRMAAKRLPQSNVNVTFARDFDDRFDAFWRQTCQRNSKLLAVRSRDVLEWRFGAGLERGDIWVLTIGSKDSLEAYAIFQRRDEPQYSLKRMRMVDFQAHEKHDEYCGALIQRAYEECHVQGIHVLEQVGCRLAQTRVFEQAATYRRKLPSWSFYYLAKNAELAGHLSRPDAWATSSYDGDASL
jgi:hypothetical protein